MTQAAASLILIFEKAHAQVCIVGSNYTKENNRRRWSREREDASAVDGDERYNKQGQPNCTTGRKSSSQTRRRLQVHEEMSLGIGGKKRIWGRIDRNWA
jgi:hypothetical protein